MTRSHPPIRSRQPATRNGFTLIELLVVLALIVLALAAAVPAFNAITGSRSTDSAENMVAAMLGRARALAIEREQMAGVAFFVNPADNRATMALLVRKSSSNQLQEDLYPQYRGWTTSAYQANGNLTAPNYKPGQEAVAIVKDAKSQKLIVGPFVNVDVNTNGTGAAIGNDPPDRPTDPANSATPWRNTYWAATGSGSTEFVDFTDEGEFETLPAGVALQLVNDPQGQTQRDRYVQTGVILFDPQGRLVSVPYGFNNATATGRSAIAQLLNIPTASYPQWPNLPPTTTPPTPVFRSQIGVVLYDRPTFANQPGHTEGDFSLLIAGVPTLPSPTAFEPERLEELWLDENTTPLLVNRYNGSLMRGQ